MVAYHELSILSISVSFSRKSATAWYLRATGLAAKCEGLAALQHANENVSFIRSRLVRKHCENHASFSSSSSTQ